MAPCHHEHELVVCAVLATFVYICKADLLVVTFGEVLAEVLAEVSFLRYVYA